MKTIEEVLKEIPEWNRLSNISYERLSGGLSNLTYKVQADHQSYVVRINGTQNEFLGLDREDEYQAVEQAARLGIGPKILPYGDTKNVLITEFVKGKGLDTEQMHERSNIELAASTLLRVHEIKNKKRVLSPFQLIHKYIDGAKKLGVSIPERLVRQLVRLDQIEARRSKDRIYTNQYCHNDYHTGYNMILSEGHLNVIDWELSGLGDAFFDLATISSDHAFTQKEDEILLGSYLGEVRQEDLNTLNDMKYVCMLREISWALLHAGLYADDMTQEMDYYGFADHVLDRLEQGIVTF